MATGTLMNYVVPYKAGDSFTVVSGAGSYTGFLNGTGKLARCIIPLTKPAEAGLIASISGSVRIRALDSTPASVSTDISLSGLTGTINDTGIAVDFTSTAVMGLGNTPCSVGSLGITVTFAEAS